MGRGYRGRLGLCPVVSGTFQPIVWSLVMAVQNQLPCGDIWTKRT